MHINTQCTYQRSNITDKKTFLNYEIELDTLVQKARRLKIDKEQSKFITMKEQSRQLLDFGR